MNLNYFPALLQGIFETMPVSSSAHLLFFSLFYPVNFEHIIHLHLFTGLAALCFLPNLTFQLLKGLFEKNKFSGIAFLCLILTLMQILASFPVSYLLERMNKNYLIAFGSIFSGLLFLIRFDSSASIFDLNVFDLVLKKVKIKQIFALFFTQLLGFFPGFSRLGSCLLSFKSQGINDAHAWQLSVLLGVPLSLGASLLTYIKNPSSFQITFSEGLISFISAYCFYYLSYKISLRFYGFYKICFGLLFIALLSRSFV